MRDEILAIANLLKKNFRQIDQIRAFVFGSATCPDRKPNDLDILIIYDDVAIPKEIRRLLQNFGYMPIHLIFLSPQEEIETNFIIEQKCISIL